MSISFMVKFVLTVKLGSNGAGITVRNVETGAVVGFTISGPREEIENILKLFESNPEVKVKYE
jgi:hypothetical protein